MTPRGKIFLLLVPLFLWPCGASVARAQRTAARVVVAAHAVARGERLTLGDIAQVHAGDEAAGVRLRSVSLGYAPSVGTARELRRERIALAISAAGFPEGSVRLEAPAVVTVRREGQTLSTEVVREAVERAALSGLRSEGISARLVRLDLPSVIEVPAGEVEVSASAGGVKDLFAPFLVSIELRVDGRVVRRLSATAQAEASADVLVAARDIAEGERLRMSDARVETRRLERNPARYLRAAERLKGKAASRAVREGEPLTVELFYSDTVVRPGDAVRIVGESDGVSLSVAGEARAAGRVGDRVQVKNVQSGALLQAVVVDEGVVSVRF